MGKVAWASTAALVLAFATLADGVACSSFSDEPTPDDAGAAEGGVADTGAPRDGASIDAPPGTFCASLSPAPAHCDDFDGSEGFARWTTRSEVRGILSITDGGASSTPHALRSFVAAAATAPTKAALSKRLTGNIAEFVFEADISVTNLVTSAGGSHVQVVGLQALDKNGKLTAAVSLIQSPSGLKLYVDQKLPTPDTSTADLIALPNTKPWTRVRIASAGGRFSVSYDGELQPQVPDITVQSTLVDLEIGLESSATQNEPQDVAFDNVVARFGP